MENNQNQKSQASQSQSNQSNKTQQNKGSQHSVKNPSHSDIKSGQTKAPTRNPRDEDERR